ncbi:MAG: hypothetical protein HZC29_01840 [Thaumarchaeota archaeon]|nr:hypothetical protein [Nitrososphaerota archaeon]
MTYRIEDFQNDPSWVRSVGEKLNKIHFRNGHWHAECDSKTGICNIHYDKDDPYESITSLIKHMSASNLGLTVLLIVVAGVLDQVFTGGQVRKSVLKSLSS